MSTYHSKLIVNFKIVFLYHITYNKVENRRYQYATSSITHNFVISKPDSVKRFVDAIDEAERDRTPKQTLPGRQLTNPQEILALIAKMKKQHD